MMVSPECRVIVAEDSLLALLGLELELRQQGIDVVGTASSIAQALALARSAVVDIAILDINLRGEMVFPAVDLLLTRGIPVIFTTGYDPTQILPPQYSGMACLRKPYDPKELIDLVSQTLMRVKSADTTPPGGKSKGKSKGKQC